MRGRRAQKATNRAGSYLSRVTETSVSSETQNVCHKIALGKTFAALAPHPDLPSELTEHRESEESNDPPLPPATIAFSRTIHL